ncbi:MAG: putative Ig domain-containing protein, partial [Clostridia bacterium]|nr:putative Ig domain-containing protein [Clostridia bacterium]
MKLTTSRKSIMGVLLVLTFAFALAVTGVVFATQTALALPSLSNVHVDKDGVLRWDAFAGAAGYSVLWGVGGGNATDGEGNSVTYYDLEHNAKQFHWESGTYNWSVYACDENGDAISATAEGTYTYTSTQTPLDAPTNLVWDHVMCRWDEVEGAFDYHICVYNAANNSLLAYDSVSTNEWHFGTPKVNVEYYFEVRAQAGFDDLDHTHSAFARSANKTFPQVVAALSGVTITEGMLTWDAVTGEAHWDVGVGSGGGDYYEKPVDLYLMCAEIGFETGTYRLRIQVYNEYDEPLAPLYTDDNFEWDTSYGPQPISGTPLIVGEAKVGVTLSVDVSGLTYEGDLTYTWWIENEFGSWIPYGEMDRTENTFYINDELLDRRLRVRVESSDSTGWVESDPTDLIAERTHTVEITSAGGNPVAAEREEGQFVEGTLPMGHMGEPYSATLVATGADGFVWSVLNDLAEGLSLNSETGVISGTPTGTANGYITVRAVDSADPGNFDIVNLTFIVAGDDWAPTITTEAVDNGVETGEYSFTIECFFVGPAEDVDWDVVAGALPAGLDLGKDGPFNGRLYGMPTLPGTYTFTVRASNAYGEDVKEFTLVVESFFDVDYPTGKYYRGDNVQLTASIGNDKVNWSISSEHSDNTTISESGLLTIGEDEDASYITVLARSKTNNNNYTQ